MRSAACLVALLLASSAAFAGPAPTGYGGPTLGYPAFRADGKVFIGHGLQGPLSHWGRNVSWHVVIDAVTGKTLARLSGPDFETAANHVPLRPGTDEVLLVQAATEGEGNQLVLRNWRDKKAAPRRLPASADYDRFAYLAFSTDGNLCVSSHQDNRLLLWDLKAGKLIRALDRPQKPNHYYSGHTAQCYFLPGDRLLATFTDSPHALYDLKTGKELPLKLPRPGDGGLVYAVSPDGKRVITSDGSLGPRNTRQGKVHPPLRLWDLKTGEKIAEFSLPKDEIASVGPVAFTNGGKSLAMLNSSSVMHVWPIAGGVRPGKPIELMDCGIAVFSPDGTRVAGGAPFQHAGAWNARTGKMLWKKKFEPLVPVAEGWEMPKPPPAPKPPDQPR